MTKQVISNDLEKIIKACKRNNTIYELDYNYTNHYLREIQVPYLRIFKNNVVVAVIYQSH